MYISSPISPIPHCTPCRPLFYSTIFLHLLFVCVGNMNVVTWFLPSSCSFPPPTPHSPTACHAPFFWGYLFSFFDMLSTSRNVRQVSSFSLCPLWHACELISTARPKTWCFPFVFGLVLYIASLLNPAKYEKISIYFDFYIISSLHICITKLLNSIFL